jgi:hypothetical protein
MREQGLRIIKKEIEKRRHKSIVIDISMGTGAIKYALKPDISSQDLIRSRGITVE